MRKLSSSEKQWTISFLFIDAIFWFFVLGSCATNLIGCLETASFGPAFFYLPFYFLSPNLGDIGNYAATLITGPIIGALSHAFLGFLFGYVLRKRSVQWFVSIPIAFVVLAVIIALSMRAAVASGFIS